MWRVQIIYCHIDVENNSVKINLMSCYFEMKMLTLCLMRFQWNWMCVNSSDIFLHYCWFLLFSRILVRRELKIVYWSRVLLPFVCLSTKLFIDFHQQQQAIRSKCELKKAAIICMWNICIYLHCMFRNTNYTF